MSVWFVCPLLLTSEICAGLLLIVNMTHADLLLIVRNFQMEHQHRNAMQRVCSGLLVLEMQLRAWRDQEAPCQIPRAGGDWCCAARV